MSDYTPSLDTVRELYAWQRSTLDRALGKRVPTDEYDAEFDRWLNQIKADAWDEGFVAGYADGAETGMTGPSNPYQEADQ